MTKLQIASKVNGLISGNERNRFEDHVGNRLSGKHVPSNKLIHHFCSNLLICDCLKYGERDSYEGR